MTNISQQGHCAFFRGERIWTLVYYEAYKARKDAMLREKRLKDHGKALGQLKRRIEHSLGMTRKVRDRLQWQ